MRFAILKIVNSILYRNDSLAPYQKIEEETSGSKQTRCVAANQNYEGNVDGLSQSDEIADLTARKYEDLYSRVNFNEDEMALLKPGIDDKVNMIDYNDY